MATAYLASASVILDGMEFSATNPVSNIEIIGMSNKFFLQLLALECLTARVQLMVNASRTTCANALLVLPVTLVTRRQTAAASAIARITEDVSLTIRANATSVMQESVAISTLAKQLTTAAVTARASAWMSAPVRTTGEDRVALFRRAVTSMIVRETVIVLHRITALATVAIPGSTAQRRPAVQILAIAPETARACLRTGQTIALAMRVIKD